MFADVFINGEPLARVVKLREDRGELSISTSGAVYAGLIEAPRSEEFIPLKEIGGIEFTFDWLAYRLDIRKQRKSDGPNLVDFGKSTSDRASGQTPLTALIVNYDLSANHSASGTGIGGLIDARVARGNLALATTLRLKAGPGGEPARATRLDTALTVIRPDTLARATAGDFISISTGGNRAVRMGGLQLATDFSLRPDLITYPLPDFTGSVAVPTGIDLLINDRRLTKTTVEPGEFTIKNIPTPVGRSGINVLLRDALGREQFQTVNFYSSRQLLRPGLVQAAVSIGAIRRNYGVGSNSYNDLAISALARRGFSQNFTAEMALEASQGFGNFGGGGSFALGGLGLVSSELRTSRRAMPSGEARQGSLLAASVESVGPLFSLRFEARRSLDGYDDLASAQGDEPPASLLAANIAFDLRSMGTITLAAAERKRQHGPWLSGGDRTTRVLSASYRKSFGNGLNLFADFSHRRSEERRNAMTALIGLSMQLGPRTGIQASVFEQDGRTQTEIGVYHPDSEAGEIGYSLQAGRGMVSRFSGSASYRGEWGRIEAQAENVAGRSAGRVSAQGSLVVADNHLFAQEDRGGSMVLVDANGIGGIAVERENRKVGATSSAGLLLISNVTPLVPTRVSIDPKQLPRTVSAQSLGDEVVAPPRAVVRLNLQVTQYLPLLFRLHDIGGQVFAPGTKIRAMPSRSEYRVGFDGIVELNSQIEDTELRVDRQDGAICYADLTALTKPSEGSLPNLHCNGRSRIVALPQLRGRRSNPD